jgi:dolichol kinase
MKNEKEGIIKQTIRDDNNINEKTIAGFLTLFFTMILILFIIYLEREHATAFITSSLLMYSGGCFGISGFEKVFKKNENTK